MTITQLRLPACWAAALVSSDFAKVSTDEAGIIRQLEKEHGPCTFSTRFPDFLEHHDARIFGVLPCECLLYDFVGETK